MTTTTESRTVSAPLADAEKLEQIARVRGKLTERKAEAVRLTAERNALYSAVPDSLRHTITQALALYAEQIQEATESVERYQYTLARLTSDYATQEDATHTLGSLVESLTRSECARFKKGGDLHNLRGYRLILDVDAKGRAVEYRVVRTRQPLGAESLDA